MPSLTQSSIAIGNAAGQWFIINASPDLPAQIRAWRELRLNDNALRNNPISKILLTNADLDHVLGVFSLREGEKLQIHATAAVRETLDSCLHLTQTMNSFCGVTWHEPPEIDFAVLLPEQEKGTAIMYRAIRLPGKPPLFDRGAQAHGIHSIAYQFIDQNTGGRLLLAPDVADLSEALIQAIHESDAVIFDGTFWCEDELVSLKPGSRTASQMGHVTIKDVSLPLLQSVAARQKIYVHINNTNPVLSPGSPERMLVEAAGIQICHDGFEFVV